MKRNKGIVTILEMISAVIILLVAFSIFFPGFSYQNKWNEATLLLKSRDFLLLIDRLGLIYNFSLNSSYLPNFASQVLDPNLIFFSEDSYISKNEIIVACNCTQEIIGNLSSLYKTKINNRDIFITFVQAQDLNNIPPSDTLIIWSEVNLSPYLDSLINYLNQGNGIVEFRDFRYSSVNPIDSDEVQRKIFGLKWMDINRDTVSHITFNRAPISSKDAIFGPYKYFYHIPRILISNSSESVAGCTFNPSRKGFISFNNTSYAFWICSPNSVWFDTNGDGTRDRLISLDSAFNLSRNNYNFTLNYIENFSIYVSFKPNYNFNDFLSYVAPPGEPEPPGKALGTYRTYYIAPIDDNWNRVLLKGISSQAIEYPAAIVNTTSGNRVAWVANILGDTNDDFLDDKKTLVLSLILWSANKDVKPKFVGSLRYGYVTSYINVVNKDMLEVYKFSFGLGFVY